ncbi:MAG: hypothetical protein WD872_12740 [Pirellulaceae bacterium]
MRKRRLPANRTRRRGTIALEWIILVTVLVVGTIGAVAAVRGALVAEYVEILDTICQMSIGP